MFSSFCFNHLFFQFLISSSSIEFEIWDTKSDRNHAISTQVILILYEMSPPIFLGIFIVEMSCVISPSISSLVIWLWSTVFSVIGIMGWVTSPRWSINFWLMLNFSVQPKFSIFPCWVYDWLSIFINFSRISPSISVALRFMKSINEFCLMSSFKSWSYIFVIIVIKNFCFFISGNSWVFNLWDIQFSSKLMFSPSDTILCFWMLISSTFECEVFRMKTT